MRLYKDSVQLEDDKKLADLHIENDDVLAMTFASPGPSPPPYASFAATLWVYDA